MRQISMVAEQVGNGDFVLLGLRSGYLLVNPDTVESVRRTSADGYFYPFVVEELLPEFDKPPYVAMRVALRPLIQPKG